VSVRDRSLRNATMITRKDFRYNFKPPGLNPGGFIFAYTCILIKSVI